MGLDGHAGHRRPGGAPHRGAPRPRRGGRDRASRRGDRRRPGRGAGHRDRLRRPPRRALPRLRRALEPGGPARRRGGELRGRGSLRGRRASGDPGLRARLGLPPAGGRHLLPDALAPLHRGLRGPGGRSGVELLPPGPGRLRGVERRGEGAPAGPARVRRSAPRRRAATPHRADRQAAAGARALRARPLVPADRGERGRRPAEAAGPRRADVGGPDLHPLPALRRAGGTRAGGARPGGPLPRRRPGRHHLLQPDDLHRAPLLRGRRWRPERW